MNTLKKRPFSGHSCKLWCKLNRSLGGDVVLSKYLIDAGLTDHGHSMIS